MNRMTEVIKGLHVTGDNSVEVINRITGKRLVGKLTGYKVAKNDKNSFIPSGKECIWVEIEGQIQKFDGSSGISKSGRFEIAT